MNCEQIRRLLAPFVGGQLDAGRHRAVELHVERCAVCARELADLRATVDALHSLDQMPVPPGFVERVRSRVEARTATRFRLWAWVAPIGAIAVLALGLGVLAPYVRTRDTAPMIVAEPPRQVDRERAETTPDKKPEQALEKSTERDHEGAADTKTETQPPAPPGQAAVSQDTVGPKGDSVIEALAPTPATGTGYSWDDSAKMSGKAPGSRSVSTTPEESQRKAEPPDQKVARPVIPPTPVQPDTKRQEYHAAEAPKPSPAGGGRPTIESFRTGVPGGHYGAADFSAATAGQRANWWAKSEPAQSQLGLLARNNLDEARVQARKAAKDSPIVVAALTSQPTPDRSANLYLNVQSMRSVANAEVTLGNVVQPAAMMAFEVAPQQDAVSRVLWKGTLAESDVKTIPLDGNGRAPIVQRADIQVAASEAKPAGKAVASKLPASEVVNFALFVPLDVGNVRPGTKASFFYAQQPLEVVFGDLAARSGLALLVRDPHGRIVDFHTPAITAQQAIRALAEQQGYHVIPDAVAWTLY